MFKADAQKVNAKEQQLNTLTSRADITKATNRMSDNFRKEAQALTRTLNVSAEKISHYYASFEGVSIKLTAAQAQAFQNSPLIESIELDQEIEVELPEPQKGTPTSPVNNSQSDYYGWFNYNHGGYLLGGANKATWIWILDTGIDMDHPDLNVQTSSPFARSFVGGTPDDCHGHGTHVAGIAAARKNNTGMVGMSEGATVVPVKILNCSGGVSGGGYSTFTSILIAGLDHVYANRLTGDVVNMSVRQYGAMSSSLTAALNRLNNAGVYLVMAAGNEARHASGCYPALYNNTRAKTIASMDYNSVFSSFSNYGIAPVDYIATGRNVYSTYKNGTYATLTGTSMAAPVVAGIIHARGNLPATSGSVYSRGQYYPKVRL